MLESLSKTKWNIRQKLPKPTDNNLASVVLENRGYSKNQIDKFLNPNYQLDLADPMLLPDMKNATKRIKKALNNNENIVIYGDYDIDGITASALLYDFLTSLNATVAIYIPDRFEEGYGLNSSALKELKDNNTDLVITVDCGVTSKKEADYAKKINLDLIITDHHDPGKIIPKNVVGLINPKLKKSKYPFKELAGVGVAFALVRAILKQYPYLIKAGQEKWLLDLVALGTVCDVVPLIGENRVLTSYGLKVLRKTRRIGLKQLAISSAIDLDSISENDLGFRFGPRLNAAGRLEHAKAALNLLISNNGKESVDLSNKLNELNQLRQTITQNIFLQADKLAKKQSNNLILVVSNKEWNSGVVGIVASRITEKHHKPAIIIHNNGKIAKGSARSWGGFSIIEAIRSCDDILEKYGGHQYAAGISIKPENIELFTYRINQYALKNIDIEAMIPMVNIDLAFQELLPDLNYIRNLELLRPYGNLNPQPVFSSNFIIEEFKLIGEHQNHIKFKLKTGNNSIDGIAFSASHKWPGLEIGNKYQIAYLINENIWQNISKPQLEIVDICNIKE